MRKVKVLMSTYNGEKYLTEQIESILRQENCEVDLLVRDDGSKDNTTQILKKYQQESKLQWYSGDNLKSANSFCNLLLNCGEEDYYAFSDQDDIWDKDKLWSALQILDKENTACCYYCNSRLIDSKNTDLGILTYKNVKPYVVENNDFLNVLCANSAMGCTMVFNNHLVKKIRENGIPDQILMHDYFMCSVCKAIGGKLFFDGTPHMSYRQHENNVIGRNAGILGAISYRLDYFFKKKSFSIANAAGDILDLYGTDISETKKEDLRQVMNYNKNIFHQIRLSMTKKLVFSSLIDALFVRLTILLNKR